jgi:hypothetical protein
MEQIAIVTCQFQDDVECIPANQLPITMQTFSAIDPVILRDEASQCAGKSEIYFVSGRQICGSQAGCGYPSVDTRLDCANRMRSSINTE